MSQNYFYNRNGYYDKSSYRSDIDGYCLENYPTSMTPSTAGACGTASDLSYRRDLIRLRQKLEERHNRIMQEKAAFQMFNDFKDNFFKTYGETPIVPPFSPPPPPSPVPSHQQQYVNLQAFPEKESYGINSAYSSNVNLVSPVLSTPTVIPPTVYYPSAHNISKRITGLPNISLAEDTGYDTTTANIGKYMEHIHNLENEKEVFETVVRALIEYQKRKMTKNNSSNVKLISEEELSSTTPTNHSDMERFKEEYLKKLDDVKSVAEDIKESVADFRQQLLAQKQQKEIEDKKMLTPVKDSNPTDDDGDIITESKRINNSGRSKSFNAKGGCTVLNNIDYTLYEGGIGSSTPNINEGCRKKTEKNLKSESERIPHHKEDVKATITNEKCETCHGYLMQKKYHENLKDFDDTITNETAHKFSSADRQFAEQTPECKCIKYDRAHEQNGDDNLKNKSPNSKYKKFEDDENVVAKKSQTLILKSKSDQCTKVQNQKHLNMSLCCLHQISSSTNQDSHHHECDATISRQQYSTSKCYFEESKMVKCVVKQHNNRVDTSMDVSDDVIEIEDPIDADTIVSYFVKRVKDLKHQCRKYRSMKDVLQKRIEEYSGIFTNENSLVC